MLNQYNATYNLQGTSETSAVPSSSGVNATAADSVLTSHETLSQYVWKISTAMEHGRSLETPDPTTISQSYNLQDTSWTPALPSNLKEPVRVVD